jgi:hypothetical protein
MQMTGAAAAFAARLRTGDISADCAKLLQNSKIDLNAWADALERTTVENGIGNKTSGSLLFYPGTKEYEISQKLVIGNWFGSNSGTSALSSMTSYQVWIDPRRLAGIDLAGAAALVAHEALHHLGLKDGAIQEGLGLTVNVGNSITITQSLKANCF